MIDLSSNFVIVLVK